MFAFQFFCCWFWFYYNAPWFPKNRLADQDAISNNWERFRSTLNYWKGQHRAPFRPSSFKFYLNYSSRVAPLSENQILWIVRLKNRVSLDNTENWKIAECIWIPPLRLYQVSSISISLSGFLLFSTRSTLWSICIVCAKISMRGTFAFLYRKRSVHVNRHYPVTTLTVLL